MKLLIFQPSRAWSYCGGGAVVVAEHIEQAQDLVNQLEDDSQKLFLSEEDIPKDRNLFNNWVLVEELNTYETQPRIILFDYNNA